MKRFKILVTGAFLIAGVTSFSGPSDAAKKSIRIRAKLKGSPTEVRVCYTETYNCGTKADGTAKTCTRTVCPQ